MRLSVVIPTRNRPADLRDLLESLQACVPPPDEIVVADDYQEADVLGELRAGFPGVVFVRLPERGYMTAARNAGAWRAGGQFIFFVDDDNVVDSDCIRLCLEAAESDPTLGVVGAKTLYHADPSRISFAGAKVGPLALARTTMVGLNEVDGPPYQTLYEVDATPNVFLVRREAFEAVGGFDEAIRHTWSEADFGERVRRLGYRVVVEGRAKVWHKGPLIDTTRLSSRHVGGSPFTLYYLTRNRYVYVARYGRWWEKALFSLLFSNLFLAYYAFSMLAARQADLLAALLLGAWDGLWYMVSGRLRDRKLAG
jgi:GT2 family glycosyltransferase